jgi:hypothetical protein
MKKDTGASLRDRATRPADQAPSGLGDTASVPSARRLSRSAKAERNRIIRIYCQAVGETARTILMSGWNQLTPHQRRQAKAVARAYEYATDALKRALEETNPDPDRHISKELP